MSTFLMPPAPQGSVQQQLTAQYAYLFQMAQQLNLALDGLAGGGVPSAAGGAGGGGAASGDQPEMEQQYRTLKSLILRTARQIRSEMDKVRLELQGEYVAVSDFGTYLEQLNSTIEADAAAITQYYKFFSDLQGNVEKISDGRH